MEICCYGNSSASCVGKYCAARRQWRYRWDEKRIYLYKLPTYENQNATAAAAAPSRSQRWTDDICLSRWAVIQWRKQFFIFIERLTLLTIWLLLDVLRFRRLVASYNVYIWSLPYWFCLNFTTYGIRASLTCADVRLLVILAKYMNVTHAMLCRRYLTNLAYVYKSEQFSNLQCYTSRCSHFGNGKIKHFSIVKSDNKNIIHISPFQRHSSGAMYR